MTDLASRPAAFPRASDAETEGFPEPHVERWPARDCILFLAAAGAGSWVVIAWVGRFRGWW